MTFPILGRLFSSNDTSNSLGGAETVVDAIYAAVGGHDVTYAVLGEPELREYGGSYDSDLKVVVPLTSDRYDDPAPLTFDIPDSLDDETSALLDFLEAIGADPAGLDELGVFDIEGTQIPVTRENGKLVPLWEEFADTADGDHEVVA